MGFSCTIYKIPLNFSLSLNKKPGTGNPNKWYREFQSFRYEGERGNTSKGITFFPHNFHQDEPFHLNSPWNFRVFHTNGKRSQTWLVYHNYGMFHFLSTPPPSPPLPKDDWHPHPRIFVGPFEKLNPKSSFFVSTVDTFVHRGWVIWPPSLEWEGGGGGGRVGINVPIFTGVFIVHSYLLVYYAEECFSNFIVE